MTDRLAAAKRAEAFFESLWSKGDPWTLEDSAYEQARFAHLLRAIDGRRYERVLEIGCGAGAFSRLVAPLAGHVLGVDVSPSAIATARASMGAAANAEFRVLNVMDHDPGADGPWDLVILSETVYYLGWLYSFFDVGWFAVQLLAATRGGGRLLLANTSAEVEDYLIRPWIIRTYHDLFANVGYRVENEDVFRGTKNGVALEVLVSRFVKPA